MGYCDSTMLAALVAIISLAGCLGQKDGGNFPTYCYDKQAWMAAIDKCYTDQGLTMPQAPKDDGDWGSKDRRDAALDVDKDGNWTKPDGNWSKDSNETKPTSVPGVTAVKDGVTWVVDKDGVWVKLESLGRREGSWDAWLGGKDGNWTKPENASKETWEAWLGGRRAMTGDGSPDQYCANRAAYDAAATCTLNLERACTPPDYMSLLPDNNNMIQAGNILCNNQNDINHLCNLNNTD